MMDIGKDLANAYEEGMRDARAKIDNEVFELQTEVKRLERICHSYALQYGTVKDQQKVIDKAKAEVEKAIDDLKRYIILNEDISKKCKSENGEQNKEYWMGKLSAFLQIRGYIDFELKKKYQEGEPNG